MFTLNFQLLAIFETAAVSLISIRTQETPAASGAFASFTCALHLALNTIFCNLRVSTIFICIL
jgi:cytochrome c biogenesis factor